MLGRHKGFFTRKHKYTCTCTCTCTVGELHYNSKQQSDCYTTTYKCPLYNRYTHLVRNIYTNTTKFDLKYIYMYVTDKLGVYMYV